VLSFFVFVIVRMLSSELR